MAGDLGSGPHALALSEDLSQPQGLKVPLCHFQQLIWQEAPRGLRGSVSGCVWGHLSLPQLGGRCH